MNNVSREVLQTLAYADIFDYPLLFDEIWRFLIAEKPKSSKIVSQTIPKLTSQVSQQQNFFVLKGREHIIEKRLTREKESKKKITRATSIAALLSHIPTVLFIGISGNVAVKNADANDDIDFFIITKTNTLWLTRFLVITLLTMLGKARRKGQKNVANTYCVNMLIDQRSLAFPKEKHNLYIAHEVTQVLPLVNKAQTYEAFLSANKWVKTFLPNKITYIKKPYTDLSRKSLFCLLEPLARFVQLLYMKRYKTKEIVSDRYLAFHPNDYTNVIMQAYIKRLKKYDII